MLSAMGSPLPSELDRLRDENASLKKRLSELEQGERREVRCSDGEPTREWNGVGGQDLLKSYQEEFQEFIYVVTHDLRSPLANLRGLAGELRLALEDLDPLKRGFEADVPAEARRRMLLAICQDIPDTIGFIDFCVSKMDRQMNQLLELSRMVRRELDITSVDLGDIVEAILQRMTAEIRAKGVRVEVRDLPRLRTDATAIDQILAHLISNAVKFLSPDRPGRVTIAGTRVEDGFSIAVADNGRGIAEKDYRRIFAPFRRLATADTPGEGMGLAIVKALARSLGASVSCASAPGEGATFTLVLPREHQALHRRRDGSRSPLECRSV